MKGFRYYTECNGKLLQASEQSSHNDQTQMCKVSSELPQKGKAAGEQGQKQGGHLRGYHNYPDKKCLMA